MEELYIPTNKDKYIGDVNKIIYRSKIELHFFNFFDRRKEILKWGSEEIKIPYLYSVDKQYHTYYPDIIIQYKNKKNEVKKTIIEIKCYKELSETVYFLLNKKSINKNSTVKFIKEILKINEIPSSLLTEYKKPKKMTKKHIGHLNGIMKNIDKWIYASEYCKKNNMEFYVFTEKDLNLK